MMLNKAQSASMLWQAVISLIEWIQFEEFLGSTLNWSFINSYIMRAYPSLTPKKKKNNEKLKKIKLNNDD